MMKSYSELEIFDQSHVDLFHMATRIVAMLPTFSDANRLRCHEVARIVCQLLRRCRPEMAGRIEIHDGRYGIVEHSWLELVGPKMGQRSILDPYCIGRLPQVQLLWWNNMKIPDVHQYKSESHRDDLHDDLIEEMVSLLTLRTDRWSRRTA